MRAVKDSHLTEENHGNSAPFPLADVGSQFAEEVFDVSPRDVAAGRSNEKGGQRLLVFLPRWPTVLFRSTTDKTERSIGRADRDDGGSLRRECKRRNDGARSLGCDLGRSRFGGLRSGLVEALGGCPADFTFVGCECDTIKPTG